MTSKLNMAAFLAPLMLLPFSGSQVVVRENGNQNNSVAGQNRVGQNRMSGRWMIDAPTGADKARLQLERQQKRDDWASVHVPLTQLQGLKVGEVHSAAARATFHLARDAGTFSFTGSFRNGRGSGEWTFKGNAPFAVETRKQGYDQLTDEQLYRIALNDIGAAYIIELGRAGYRNLAVNELISLYSNNVRASYISSLEAVGYAKLSPRDLIALKTNGVTEAYIKSLQTRGYRNLSVERILSLRTNPGN